MNKTISKKLLCVLVVFTLLISQFAVVSYAAKEIEKGKDEAAAVAGYNVINAITDYSTYGARDSFEMSAAEYAATSNFSDVEDSALLSKLAFLYELGFITKADDGLYRPADKVTRIELVTTLLKLLNVKVTELSEAYVNFYDIPKDYEYFNEVNTACSMKLINGFDDNTFKPNDYISSQDFLTILVRALGYNMDAQQHGGYPMGYLYEANSIGLLNSVSLASADEISRAEAGYIYYNFLHSKVQKQTVYGQMLEYSKDTNVLEEYHDIYKKTGRVLATEFSGLGTTPATKEGYINISNKLYKCDLSSQFALLTYEVDYYYYSVPEESDDVVKYMVKSKNNEEIMIQSEDIISYKNNVLTFYDKNKKKTEEVDIDHNVFYNGILINDYDESTFVPKTGYIKLVKDIATEDYKYVFISSFFNYYVSGLSLNGTKLTFETPNTVDLLEIDLEEIKWELYDKNGKLTAGVGVTETFNADGIKIKSYSLPPIPSNSLISIFTDKMVYKNGHYSVGDNAKYVKVYMNSENVTGDISSIDYDESGRLDSVVIDSTNYYVSKDNFLNEKGTSIKVGQKGTFNLDFDGKLASFSVAEGSAEYEYAYLINAFLNNGLAKSIDFKLMKLDGAIAVYNSAKNLKINDVKYTNLKQAMKKLQDSAALLEPTFTISQLVKVKFNANEEVSDLQVVRQIGSAQDPDNSDELVCNAVRKEYGSYSYGGNSLYTNTGSLVMDGVTKTNQTIALYGKPNKILVCPSTETFEDKDYTVAQSWKPDKTDKTLDVFDVDEGLTPKVVISYETLSDEEFDVPFIFVDSISKGVDEEGAVVDVLNGWSGFGEVKYYCNKIDLLKNCKRGDLITIYGDKKTKTIKSYEKFYNVFDVLNGDYSLPQQGYKDVSGMRVAQFENYYYTSGNRMLVLQTGAEGEDNKRAYQRVFHWTTTSNVLRYGILTVTIDDDNKIEYKTGGPADLHPAKNYGHKNSSKILIMETSESIIKYMLIVNRK